MRNQLTEDSQGPMSSSGEPLDSPKARGNKNQALFYHFKHNQHQLKSKFKSYIISQQLRYPLVTKRIATEHYQQSHEQLPNLRTIRNQKHRLTQQLQESLNSSNYIQKKEAEHQKTFLLLKNKCKKVASIRQQHRDEVSKYQQKLKEMFEQVRGDKLKYRKSIEQSKLSLSRSKICCERQKFTLAEQARKQAKAHQKHLSQEKNKEIQHNRAKHQSVRQNQKHVKVTLDQHRKTKREQAEKVKLERLFRQLAEKEQIKIASSSAKQLFLHCQISEKKHSDVIGSKIQQFRKSLGQRRLQPSHRLKYDSAAKQGSQQFQSQTSQGYPQAAKGCSFTQQIVP